MKLILDRWQGLGDNLQVSTIPRRFYELYGEKCVWISDAIYYRNSEIRKLVWEMNPYIAGFTDEKGQNLTHLLRYDGIHWIGNWERAYGLPEPYSERPEIYYNITNEDKHDVKDKILVDMSYSDESYKANIIDRPHVIKNTKKFFDEKNIQDFTIATFINLKNNKYHKEFWKENFDCDIKNICINNIYEYSEIIKHCKHFICSHSGCQGLAASIKENFTCLIPEENFRLKNAVYPNIEYILV